MWRKYNLAVLTTCVLAITMIGVIVRNISRSEVKPPELSSYLLTKPEVLFSIPYGKELSQVGMFIPDPSVEDSGEPSGPSDFAVGFDGSIYIGDEQNGKVKKFSRDGKLLMVTEGYIDRIAGIAIDKQGRIYVIHGTFSDKVAVYDENGKRLEELERKIKGALSQAAALSNYPELKKEVLFGEKRLGIVAVKSDSFGNLYFETGEFFVKINADFTEARAFRGYPLLNTQGSYYSYRVLPSQQIAENVIYGVDGSIERLLMPILERIEITIYDVNGEVKQRFTLPRGEWSEVERLVPIRGSDVYCDERGHFYVLCSPTEIYHVPLKPDNPEFFVVHYSALLEYDSEGNFVGLRAIIDEFTMPSVHWFEIDKQGNVYWLDFKSDHLNVMISPKP